jgi:glycosyltransferase involved in cell wall biosynthesis
MPRVTVVIPCFDDGRFLDEAVDSVLRQTFRDLEIIVVDDGSTDAATRALLDDFHRPRTMVIRADHAGPAAARNRGIGQGTGEFVLPLDADDRVGETYLEKAVRQMDADPALGVVYCLAEYFGERSGSCGFHPYALPEILWNNMIFCSGLYRRADWAAVGGYRPVMEHGWEDWDFWLSLIERGRGVHRIPETLFFYRVKPRSRNRAFISSRSAMDRMLQEIVARHLGLYAAHVSGVYQTREFFVGREALAARIALAALSRLQPLRGLPRRAASAAALLAWAAMAPLRS